MCIRDRPSAPLAPTVWGPDCYLVPWSDGTVLVGATVEEAGFENVRHVKVFGGFMAIHVAEKFI